MSNTLQNSAKNAFLSDLLTDDIRVVLVDTALYTYSAAHSNISDVAVGARVATSSAMTGKTVTNGVFDADDVSFASVSGATIEAIWIYNHTSGVLLVYIDTATGLTLTPNSGGVTVQWNASGIFGL